ncbi:MAG: hypothetical protein ACPHQR_08290, partial [Candidatus Poseidoniaceae archaeon]
EPEPEVLKEPEPEPEVLKEPEPKAGQEIPYENQMEFGSVAGKEEPDDEPEGVFDKVKEKLINPPRPKAKPKKKVIIEESESGSESDDEPVVYVRKTSRKKKEAPAPAPAPAPEPPPMMNFNPYQRGMPPSITRQPVSGRQPVFNPFHGIHRSF